MTPTMWSGVLREELLEPEQMLPAQFYDASRRKRAAMPELSLAIAVMGQAIDDLRVHRFGKRLRHQRIYMDAYQWVASDDRTWPFSFLNLCELLNLPADALRMQLVGEPTPAQGDAGFYPMDEVGKAA